MADARIETAELTAEEIGAAADSVLELARQRFGEQIGAKSVDLRLWAAAALIDSAFRVSTKQGVMRSLEQKLAFMRSLRGSV